MNVEAARLIGITEQQFEILRALDLAASNKESKPKNIEAVYEKLTNRIIQKSNLFAQLRELQNLQVIIKRGGSYAINKDKLKQILVKRQHELNHEITRCGELVNNVDRIFKSNVMLAAVIYFSLPELYKIAIEKMNTEKSYFYRTGHIPEIAFSDEAQRLYDVEEYVRTIIEYCTKRKLSAKYILTLNPARAFIRAFQVFGSESRALDEVNITYKKLAKLSKIPNLNFFYLDIGTESTGLIENECGSYLFLSLRASASQLSGAVMTENKNACEIFREMFDGLEKKALLLNEASINKIAKEKLRQLKRSAPKLVEESKLISSKIYNLKTKSS